MRSTIEVSGRRLEALEIPARPPAPELVLLHEGLGSVGLWRDFPQRLAAATGARVLAYSRFGHGDSDPPPEPRTPRFMHEEAASVLPAVLSALEVRDPVLVGHSDGASIALIHAAANPVRAVVAIAPHVFVAALCLEQIRLARDAYAEGELRARMARHHRDPDAAFHGWNDVWLHPEFPGWSIEGLLERIASPLLLIQGERDQYGTMAQLDAIERRVAGTVERRRLDCRHAPHLEAPEATVAAIAAFVAALSQARRSSDSK